MFRLKQRTWYQWGIVLAPAVLFFLFFFVIPMLVMFLQSFLENHSINSSTFTFKNYLHIFSSQYYWKVLGQTFLIGLEVTFFSLVIGYTLAYVMVRIIHNRRIRRIVYMLVLAPLFTSAIVRAFGWFVILGRQGIVNKGLMTFGFTNEPVSLLFNQTSIVIGLTHILVPFMILSITSVLQNIDISFELAARDLGASSFQSFRTIIFPLTRPGILSGSLIVFTLAVSSYVVPSVLGGGKIKVMPTLVYEEFMVRFNWAFGSALAIFMLAATLVIVVIMTRLLSAHNT